MNILKRVWTEGIIKNILLVASGTAISQIIVFIFTPLITRIYGPEEFGVLGVFMSGVAIFGIIAALTYPTAIVLPTEDDEARSIARVSFMVTVLMFFLSIIIILFLGNSIISIFKIDKLGYFIYLFPFVILFSGFSQIVYQWMIRSKMFKIIATVSVQHVLIVNLSKFLIGLIKPLATVLIFISTVGIFLQSILYKFNSRVKIKKISMKDFAITKKDFQILKKYKDFPIYRAPQVFINAVSQNIPILILSFYFGPVAAGFYTLARSVLNVPIGLIGKAVGDVLYPKLTELFNSRVSIRRSLVRTTMILTMIGIIPFGVLFIFGPWLFELIFGAKWYIAGEYARWMSIWIFTMFINRPVVAAIPILSLQRGFLFYEVITTIIKVIVLVFSILVYDNSLIAVSMFSIVGVISYLYLIFWVIVKSN